MQYSRYGVMRYTWAFSKSSTEAGVDNRLLSDDSGA